MKTYIDEAGNTGNDLSEKNQLFFILSAISIDKKKLDTITDVLHREFEENKEKEETEIKAKSWSKAPKKRNALQKIIEKLCEEFCDIVICVLEKRYMIAAKIVDYFFDGAHNNTNNFDWVNNKSLKIETANYYYDKIPEERIDFLWEAIRNINKEELNKVLNYIIKITDKPQYLSILKNVRIDDVYEADKSLNEMHGQLDISQGISNSPNYTSFFTLGNIISQNCLKYNFNTELIFDSELQCNRAFEYLFKIFSKSKKDIRINEETIIYSWKDRITKFEAKNGKSEPLLQLADILSSSVNQLMLKIHKNETNYTKFDAFIMYILMGLDKIDSVHYTISKSFYLKFTNAKMDIASRIETLR